VLWLMRIPTIPVLHQQPLLIMNQKLQSRQLLCQSRQKDCCTVQHFQTPVCTWYVPQLLQHNYNNPYLHVNLSVW